MSAGDVAIRPATADDATRLALLLRSLEHFDWLHEEPLPTIAAHARQQVTSAGDCRSLYVADAGDDALAGYLAVHWLPYLIMRGPEGFVSELFLLPDARGRGIGSRLLAAAVAEARARGCSRLGLLNNRRRESYQRSFYAERGWTERTDMANFVLFLDH